MTARHPFSENTLQHRNHRPPHETHSAQAVETPFEKTQEDKMTSAALRSIGTRASCHRRNRRGFRFRETEYEMRASREPDSGSVGGFKRLPRILLWEIGGPLLPGFTAAPTPRFREGPREHAPAQAPRGIRSPHTDGLRFRNENTAGRKNGRAHRPLVWGCGRPLYFHRLAKLSLQRTKHRGDIPQHIRDPLFLLPVSSALQAAPDHFDIRPHIPSGTRSSIAPPSPRKAHDYVGQNAAENPTRQDSRSERLTTLPPDALRAAPKRLGIRSHRPESHAGTASVALAHAAGISDTCSSAGTTRDRHRNNAAAGRSAIRGHGNELPQSVHFQSGNAIQKTGSP